MENNPLLVKKMCGLFPSSLASYCHIRTLTDVAHFSSIPLSHYHHNNNHNNNNHLSTSSSSSFHSSSSSTLNPPPSSSSSSTLNVKGPKYPPVSPNPTSSTLARASRISSSSNGGSQAQSDDSETGRSGRKTARKCSRKAAGGGVRRTAMMSSSDQVSSQLYYCSSRGAPRSRRNGSRKWRRSTTSAAEGEGRGRGIGSWYAVEKRTVDPRGEFRASMVEMIVEREMVLGADELERLLLSFLALNSDSYHGMILQVFSEICESLFC